MCNTQRLFVQKVFKQSAADAALVSHTELDYEKFWSHHMIIRSRDPLKHFLDFPQGDESVEVIPRKIRNGDHIVSFNITR